MRRRQEQKEQKDPEGLHRKQTAASRRKPECQQSLPRQKDLQRQAPLRDQWAGGREPGGSSGDPAKSAREAEAAAEAVFVVIPAGANGAAGSAAQARTAGAEGTAGTVGTEGPGRAPPQAGGNRPAEATV